MRVADWLMIFAVLLAPVMAVQISVFLERIREKRQRRMSIFRTLMTTRASRMAPEHVQALNMIDVEFASNDKASKAVVAAWKAYLDHLNSSQMNIEVWTTRGDDLFVDLLHTMAVALGYDYDKTHIRRTSYYPRGYGDSEWDQLNIRRGLREVLEGKRWIPVWAASAEQYQLQQQELSSPQELAKSEQPLQVPATTEE